MPTHAQVRQVRKVLYGRKRLKRFAVLADEIDIDMNLDYRHHIPDDDVRVTAGGGPRWIYPSNGRIELSVREAAERCERIADLLREMRSDIGELSIPRRDRRRLRRGLKANAQAWEARARIWRRQSKPDVKSDTAEIAGHLRDGQRAFRKVKRYLKRIDLEEYL